MDIDIRTAEKDPRSGNEVFRRLLGISYTDYEVHRKISLHVKQHDDHRM
jgi:hypothetical protein